ncbi:RNA polymerase subunit sigma-54 [Clostridia bacterium]|nr:RNA polymerase subunit sigma-54 [Clostridia bacterium]
MIIALIMAIENEDDRAFMMRLYIDMYPLMKGTAYEILKDYGLSEDIAHEAIIKLIDKMRVIKELKQKQLAFYIYRTVLNLSINYYNKHMKAGGKEVYIYDDDIGEIADTAATPEEQTELRVDYEHLSEAIQKLSERDRDLLYFKYYLELSNKEIAERMSIKPDNVGGYLTRARRRIKTLIEKSEG